MRSDLALSRRLERAEGIANARFVETRARVSPDSGAQWIEVAGTYAMYDGPESPCTQTFGLGLFQAPAAADLDCLEAFFRDRGAAVFHEVSPLAGIAVVGMLHERGYRPVELSSILYLPLDPPRPEPSTLTGGIQVRVAGPQEMELWARTAAEGWSDVVEFRDLLADLMLVSAERRDMLSFLAELEGQPIAAGSLILHDGVALLAGASTIRAWRNRGAQRALFEARLAAAGRAGCELAMIGAEPGSASQRNAERQGFRIAYTRTKWCLGK
jgi:Acetyltransferase (GNAT) family